MMPALCASMPELRLHLSALDFDKGLKKSQIKYI